MKKILFSAEIFIWCSIEISRRNFQPEFNIKFRRIFFGLLLILASKHQHVSWDYHNKSFIHKELTSFFIRCSFVVKENISCILRLRRSAIDKCIEDSQVRQKLENTKKEKVYEIDGISTQREFITRTYIAPVILPSVRGFKVMFHLNTFPR